MTHQCPDYSLESSGEFCFCFLFLNCHTQYSHKTKQIRISGWSLMLVLSPVPMGDPVCSLGLRTSGPEDKIQCLGNIQNSWQLSSCQSLPLHLRQALPTACAAAIPTSLPVPQGVVRSYTALPLLRPLPGLEVFLSWLPKKCSLSLKTWFQLSPPDSPSSNSV